MIFSASSMDIFTQQLVNGLVLGSIYALVALGEAVHKPAEGFARIETALPDWIHTPLGRLLPLALCWSTNSRRAFGQQVRSPTPFPNKDSQPP